MTREGIAPARQDAEPGFHIATKGTRQMSTQKPGKYAEGILFDASHLPAGYVELAQFHNTEKALHNFALRACRAGRVRRFRVKRSQTDSVGFLFVHAEDFEAMRVELASKKAEPQQQCDGSCESAGERLAVDGLVDHAADMRISLTKCCAYLGDIYDVLETIARATEATAKAVEEIATQPKTPQQELLRTLSSNGFHS
jgi:hypothetical protein